MRAETRRCEHVRDGYAVAQGEFNVAVEDALITVFVCEACVPRVLELAGRRIEPHCPPMGCSDEMVEAWLLTAIRKRTHVDPDFVYELYLRAERAEAGLVILRDRIREQIHDMRHAAQETEEEADNAFDRGKAAAYRLDADHLESELLPIADGSELPDRRDLHSPSSVPDD